MLEARIILPTLEIKTCEWLRYELVKEFGGLTRSQGAGDWIDPDGKLCNEAVMLFDVACEPTERNNSKLFNLALIAGLKAEQQCVYLRFPSGEVQLVQMPGANEPREERNTGSQLDSNEREAGRSIANSGSQLDADRRADALPDPNDSEKE